MKNSTLKRLAMPLCLLLAAVLLLGACGGSAAQGTDMGAQSTAAAAPAAAPNASYNDMKMSDSVANYEMAAEYATSAEYGGETAAYDSGGGSGPTLTLPQDDRKVILTAWLTLEGTDFEATCNALQAAVKACGGYVDATNLYSPTGSSSRSASFTMRIPAENYGDFLNAAADAGNMTQRNEQSEDVTEQYFDMEARLSSMDVEKASLLRLMEQAESIDDLITLQSRLSDVQYQIDYYQSIKNSLDKRIAYSTVNIDVQEVQQYTEPPKESYWGRLGKAFQSGWNSAGRFFQNLGLAIVGELPSLIFLALLVVIIVVAVRRRIKKRKARSNQAATPTAPPAPQTPPQPADSTEENPAEKPKE